MSNLPDDPLLQPEIWPQEHSTGLGSEATSSLDEQSVVTSPLEPAPITIEPPPEGYAPPPPEQPLFYSWTQPEVHSPVRIPHLGHLLLVAALAFVSLVVASLLFYAGVHIHLFGVRSMQQAGNDIHYILGVEGLIYLFTFGASLLVFPMFWHKSLFAGLQWNGAAALRLRGRLVSAAFVCFVFAWLNGYFLPGPTNTPIEKIFRAPGAAWMLFAFGVTFAPFFEEMLFRGFLLPSLCTAYDWIAEQITRRTPPPLLDNGHPQWSLPAMIVGSIATSIPFAAMHAEQTGYSIGPFLLLVGVSLVLCTVRLSARSLAASTLVHACYNFLLFSLMLIGTGGFRHLDKM
jgi:membrane protease YdiL (CAAX protease family)